MALSAIALCSRALLKIGAATIASFDEGTAEAEVANNLYGPIRDKLLAAHQWSFACDGVSELSFPPFFDQALIARLAAEFCIPLTESEARAVLLDRLANDELRRAKLIDGMAAD